MKELKELDERVSNNNKNHVRVNNNITLTINLGDSLNIFAVLGSIFVAKRLVNKRKAKRKKMQWP